MMERSPNESYQALINTLLTHADPLPALEGKTISGGCLNIAKALGAYSEEASSDSSIIAQDEAKRGGSAPADLTVLPPRKIPLIPGPLKQFSDKEKKFFGWGSVVQSSEIEGPRPGQKIRIRILDTNYNIQ